MTEVKGTYTPAVKKAAEQVRKLSVGELVALRDALAQDFDILPPDIGVREPRRPSPSGGREGALIDDD